MNYRAVSRIGEGYTKSLAELGTEFRFSDYRPSALTTRLSFPFKNEPLPLVSALRLTTGM